MLMLTILTLVVIGLGMLAIALAPQPDPPLLIPPLPPPPVVPRPGSRRHADAKDEADTLDWIGRVKDVPERGSAPWGAAPPPPRPAQTMVSASPDGARYWPPGMTGAHELVRAALDHRPPGYDEAAAFQPLAAPAVAEPAPEPAPEPEPLPEVEAERPWYLAKDEPEPAPPAEPEEPRAWQPGDPDNTVVRGIKAFTEDELREYEESLRYGDRQ